MIRSICILRDREPKALTLASIFKCNSIANPASGPYLWNKYGTGFTKCAEISIDLHMNNAGAVPPHIPIY